METPTYVVLLAGGSGQRMGNGLPKQFLPLAGRPILLRTLERFEEALDRPRFVLVLPKDHIPRWMELCRTYGRQDLRCTLCPGGLTRFHSVQNALAHVPEGVRVAIHDSVRPLVTVPLIRAAFSAAATHPAVIPVVPIVDSLRRIPPPAEGGGVAAGSGGVADDSGGRSVASSGGLSSGAGGSVAGPEGLASGGSVAGAGASGAGPEGLASGAGGLTAGGLSSGAGGSVAGSGVGASVAGSGGLASGGSVAGVGVLADVGGGGSVSTVVSREHLYAVQTPQVFDSTALKAAYTQAYRTEFTDDASVAEAAGLPLHFLPGHPTNLKITRPQDLDLAHRLL